jgi:MFS family permease
VFALLTAIATYTVASTMITPALPSIAMQLKASTTQIGLEQSLFFAIGGLTAASLPLSDRFGRRRMLVTVVALGVVGSVLVAATHDLALFDLGRWLEAPGVAALPLSYLILRDHVDSGRYPLYFGWLNALNTGITGLDAVAAGWLTDSVGYQGIFWIGSAAGVLTLTCVLLIVPASQSLTTRTDWLGTVLLGGAVVALSTGLAQSGAWGWTAPGTLILLGSGAALLAAFVLVERSIAHPLAQVGYLADRRVWSVAAVIVTGMAGFATVYGMLLPFLSETPKSAGGFGFSATVYSLATVPGTFLALCAAPALGSLARRTGWRPILISTTVIAAIGLIALVAVRHTAAPTFVFNAAFTCAWAGGSMTAASGLGVVFSPRENPAFLPGIVSVMFSFGASIGFSVGGSLLARGTQAAFTDAFTLTAVLVVCAALLTVLVPRLRSADSPGAAESITAAPDAAAIADL